MKSASCPPSQADRSLFTAPLSRPILIAAAGPSDRSLSSYFAPNPQKSRPAAAGSKRRAHCGLESQEVRSSGVAEAQEANTYDREQILASRLRASRILHRIDADESHPQSGKPGVPFCNS